MALIKMLHDVFDFPGNEVSKEHPHGAEEKRDNSSHPYPNSGAACHVSMIELLYSPIYSLSPPLKKKKKKLPSAFWHRLRKALYCNMKCYMNYETTTISLPVSEGPFAFGLLNQIGRGFR